MNDGKHVNFCSNNSKKKKTRRNDFYTIEIDITVDYYYYYNPIDDDVDDVTNFTWNLIFLTLKKNFIFIGLNESKLSSSSSS